jgi:hypothetical protein
MEEEGDEYDYRDDPDFWNELDEIDNTNTRDPWPSL